MVDTYQVTFDQIDEDINNQESILIVDDQPANLRVLATMLEGRNYKVKKASDGESALLAAQSNPPDLILLDILMPDMNGYEVCEKLKQSEITAPIPVIFISALNDVFDKIKAFEVGGIDYITKPFQEEEVVARINSQLTIQTQQKLIEKERELLKNQQQSLLQEIRHRKETEAILYQSRALISSILNASLDGIAALESVRDTKTGDVQDFRCIVVNPITAQVFNLEPEDLIGKLVFRRFISKINPQLFPAFVQVVETGKALEKDIKYTINNKICWYHFIAVKLGDGFSVTVRDITERKKLELKLNKLATFDGLTKVYNRQSFDQNLSKEWTRGAREKQPLSLIICDVDYFKPYNDFYGHIQGDKCLKKVAEIMAEIVKRSSDFLARYGGEEFAIILPNTPLTGALAIAETLRLTVENLAIPHAQSEISPVITISLGVSSTIPDANLPFDTLVKGADLALYQAKSQGRNCVVSL